MAREAFLSSPIFQVVWLCNLIYQERKVVKDRSLLFMEFVASVYPEFITEIVKSY